MAARIPALLASNLGGVVDGEPTIMPLGPIIRDAYHYVRMAGAAPLQQLLLTPFDPDTGKATGMPSFVSRRGGRSRSPSFSADGRWLSYVVEDKDLVVKSMESGEERVVPISPAFAQIDWAVMFPDGRSFLIVAVHPKEGQRMYRVDAASGAWTPVQKPGEAAFRGFPDAISPDGRTIYSTAGRTPRTR